MQMGALTLKRIQQPLERLDPDTRQLFAYLDGELQSGERAAFEARMKADCELAAEVRAFRSLLDALDRLAAFAPSADFKLRVLASWRARGNFRALVRRVFLGTPHPAVRNVFTELIEEGLSPRQARTLAAFVGRDREAAAALARWKRFHERLDQLPAFEPPPGFQERVMARVSVHPASAVAARRAPGWAVRLWPERRQRLAAVLGVAFAPTALSIAFAYSAVSIFSNPLVTPADALRFVWNKGAEAASAAAETLFGGWTGGFDAAGTGGLGGALLPLAALGLLVLSGLALISARILYRQVAKSPGLDRGHASV